MSRLIIFFVSVLLSGCGMNRAYVESQAAGLTNEQLIKGHSVQKQLETDMIFPVPNHMRMQSEIIDAELQKRGITGPGLPPLIGPPKQGQSEDFGLHRPN